MRKKILIIISALLLVGAGFLVFKFTWSRRADSFELMNTPQIIGAFDTASVKLTQVSDEAKHYTLKWMNNAEKALPADSLKLYSDQQQALFIHLQIWPLQIISKLAGNPGEAVVDGKFDAKLIAFFKLLSGNASKVYLSYNAEMEVPVYKYPWQAGSFGVYINSFRHIYKLCKTYAPKVQMVWGPSGYPGAEEYWPGENYVDVISLNLTMEQEVKKDNYLPYASIQQLVMRKLFRVRFMNKPVLLLSTASVTGNQLQPAFDRINSAIEDDRNFFRTPVTPAEHDTAAVARYDSLHLQLGVYDPKLLLVKEPLITTEHIFTDMNGVMDGSFKLAFDSIISRHHNAIVTIEPWKLGKVEKDSLILEHTLEGTYDKVWSALYHQISNVPQTVYLRWGHEMEIPVDRYAWQRKDPITYIKAFRYFAHFQQPRASNIKIVWGPAGDRGSIDWWPGEDVVDLVSIAIYGLPDKNINDYNRQNSFSNIFRLKFYRMRFTHKPIFITEFGVKGPEDYQKKWMDDAAATINKYPEIVGACYFNFADVPKAWGNAETPVWSVSQATFKSFTSKLINVPHQ